MTDNITKVIYLKIDFLQRNISYPLTPTHKVKIIYIDISTKKSSKPRHSQVQFQESILRLYLTQESRKQL